MLKNKKVIIASFSVAVFLLVTFFYFTQKKDGIFMSGVKCDYATDEVAYAAAVNQIDGKICSCIDDNEMQEGCYAAMDEYVDHANSLAHKGSVEFKEEEYGKKSIEILEKILKTDPENIDALLGMGYAYEIMQKYDTAIQYYERALAVDANNDEIQTKIGHLYDLRYGFEKAEPYYKRAAQNNPGSLNAKYNLARGYFRNNKIQEATEILEEVFYQEDVDKRVKAEVGYLLSTISMDAEQYDDARMYIETAQESDPSLPIVWVGLGLVKTVEIESANSNEEASIILNESIAHFDKALSIYSDSTMAHYWKGRILLASGNENEAQEAFIKARDSVERDITLMQDEKEALKIEIDRFIGGSNVTSYHLKNLVNEAHARNVLFHGSYSGFLAAVRSESRPGHVFIIYGNTAVCNNGWSLTWVPPPPPPPPTCRESCGSWSACSKSCGGGEQSRRCTRSNCSRYTQTRACNTHPCPVNGKCNTSVTKMDYPYTTNQITNLCANGTRPTIGQPARFPVGAYGSASLITWGCNGLNGGSNTGSSACRAQRVPPTAVCQHLPEANTKPAADPGLLCQGCDNCSVTEPVFTADGRWTWDCTHNVSGAEPQTVTCEAPTCLSGSPINVDKTVYLNENDEPNVVDVSVQCQGRDICCEIDGQVDDGDDTDQDNFVCTGDVGEITVSDGGESYDARCWFKGDPETVDDNFSIQTICTARSCNEQGTCQSTPQFAASFGECKSTCSSNADCSTGRMIETRP